MSSKLLCMLLAAVLLVNCGRSARGYCDKGNALLAQGKYADAELNYRKAIQKDPKFGEAYHRLGLAELELRKPREAYQALLLAVQLMPDNEAAKVDLVSFALSAYLQDPRRPKVLYDLLTKLSGELLQKDPRSYVGLRAKAYVALVDHKPAEAERLFRGANESRPRQPEVIVGWMEALVQQSRSPEAEKLGLDAVAADKKAAWIYDTLYRLYVVNKRPDQAEKILVRKVQDNPQEGAYVVQLAAYYAQTHNSQEMTAALQPLLKEPSSIPQAHLFAGDFYLALGDPNRALEQFKVGAAADPKEDLLYKNRIARVLLIENKRDEAIRGLDGSIKTHPESKEAKALRAAAVVENATPGKLNEGVKEFQGLVDQNSGDVSLRYLFARALLDRGNLVAARTQLIDVTRRSPGSLLPWIDLAELALRQIQPAEALKFSGAALEIDPSNNTAQFARASALLALGELDQAEAAFGTLTRELPKSVDVRLRLALIDLKRKRFSRAEADYKRILDASPGEWRALAGLVDTYAEEQHLEKAFPLLEAELKKSSDAAAVRSLLGDTAVRAGRYDLAIEQFRQLAAQKPRAADPLMRLASVLQRTGDLSGAIATLQKASAAQPGDAPARAMLADLLQQANRAAEAKAQLRQALSLQPDDPYLMNNLAFMLADSGDSLDEALKLARGACDQAPGNPNYSDTLAWVYLKKGLNDDALQLLHKLTGEHADNSTFVYHFGVALYQHGDKAAAKLQLSHALALRPSPELQDRIKKTLSQLD